MATIFKDGEPDRLLGYPAYTSAFAPKAEKGNLCSLGDFLLQDWR
ncbi:MAG: hypothetical protein ACLTA5_06510 [Anaerococcus obesiensis]